MAKGKVLIVGGGFAGVKAALELADDPHFSITLLSDRDSFNYYPTLFHVAAGGRRANARIPLKNIFNGKPVNLQLGRAIQLDRQDKCIITADKQRLPYDTLILALGVVTNYFNIPGLESLSYGVKSIEQVERFKQHLHRQLIEEKRPDLNYVIVGGGPTGIELAGALPAYLKHLLRSHGLSDRSIHIDLVEAAPHLLPRLPRDASKLIRQRLRRLGIRLYLGQTVKGETADSLIINNKQIQSHTVIWTAGTRNHPFFSDNNFSLTYNHKVATDVYLQAEDNIFVLGDNANTPFSGLAQTAIIDGHFVAKNLKRQACGKQFKSYRAKRPITIMPVGEGWAAVISGNLRIYGWLGWVLRHLADIWAFHDFEPWTQAGKQWATYFGEEENCPICRKALGKPEKRTTVAE